MESYDIYLQRGIILFYAWLQGYSRHSYEHVASLPTPRDFQDYLARSGELAGSHHYTLVQVLRGPIVVGVMFAECNGQDVSLHWLVVSDSQRYGNAEDVLLAWYLSGLPNATETGIVRAAVLAPDMYMRRRYQRFGGIETGGIGENGLLVMFGVENACARLPGGIPSGGAGYNLQPGRIGPYTIRVVFAGQQHPKLTNLEKPPIMSHPVF